MAKKYERVTPVGYFTGKVMIGGHHLPKPKAMTEHEYFIQGLILGRKLPLEVRTRDFWLKIKSVFRNSHLYFNR